MKPPLPPAPVDAPDDMRIFSQVWLDIKTMLTRIFSSFRTILLQGLLLANTVWLLLIQPRRLFAAYYFDQPSPSPLPWLIQLLSPGQPSAILKPRAFIYATLTVFSAWYLLVQKHLDPFKTLLNLNLVKQVIPAETVLIGSSLAFILFINLVAHYYYRLLKPPYQDRFTGNAFIAFKIYHFLGCTYVLAILYTLLTVSKGVLKPQLYGTLQHTLLIPALLGGLVLFTHRAYSAYASLVSVSRVGLLLNWLAFSAFCARQSATGTYYCWKLLAQRKRPVQEKPVS